MNIFFARSNILHKEQNYEESSRYLKLANKLKLDLNPSKPEIIFNKSKLLLIESNKRGINQEKNANSPESIFIVGMFRSGSTLLESILNMRTDVYDLGESDFLEKSFFESRKSKKEINLSDLYWKKLNNKTKLPENIFKIPNLYSFKISLNLSESVVPSEDSAVPRLSSRFEVVGDENVVASYGFIVISNVTYVLSPDTCL